MPPKSSTFIFKLFSGPQGTSRFILALLLLILIGGGLRFYRLGEKSLWSDEIATIATSLGHSIDPEAYALHGTRFDPPTPVPAAWYREKATASDGQVHLERTAIVLQDNVHPPLFFWLMAIWNTLQGFPKALSPASLRIPAAIFGTLCIPAMAWLALQIASLNNQGKRWLTEDAHHPTSPSAEPTQSEQHALTQAQAYGFALMAALLMAISGYQVDHAQDARQYTLVLLLGMLSMGLAIGCLQRKGTGWWQWLLLGITLTLGLYTQYFFILFAGFIVLFLSVAAWHSPIPKRRFFLNALAMATLIGLLFLPWWPFFQAQMHFFAQAGHYTAGLWKPLQLPEKLWRILCEFFIPAHPLGKVLPALIVGISAWMAWGKWNAQTTSESPSTKTNAATTAEKTLSASNTQSEKRPWTRRLSPVLWLLLGWLLVVIGGQVAMDILKHTHTATIRRYLLLASPACYLMVAYALLAIGQWTSRRTQKATQIQSPPWFTGAVLMRLFFGGMLVLMLNDTVRSLLYTHTSSDEFRQAAQAINRQHPTPQDLVLVSKSGAMAVGIAYYLTPDTRMLGINVPNSSVLNPGTPTLHTLNRAIEKQTRVWLVLSHASRSTERRLSGWLHQQGYHLQERQKFPGVKVMRWQSSPAPAKP